MIRQLKGHIDKALGDFLLKIKKEYCLHLTEPILFESIKEFSLRPGKRIRPLLVILSYKGYAKKNARPLQSLYRACICMELLHNFMLIHDDIIDRSNLRRGKPTVHKILRKAIKTKESEKLGYDLAIVVGDIIYALAVEALLSVDVKPHLKEKALRYFIKTAAFTAVGESIDILQGVKSLKAVTEKDVFLNYTLKTAHYTFECPLIIGATLAGAPKSQIKKLSRFGIMVGQAFQIQDDILGMFGSKKSTGKSILSDLVESKKTILVCHAYYTLPVRKRKIFEHHFLKKKKTYQDLIAIRKMLLDSGSLCYSLRKIQSLLDKSQDILNKLSIKDKYRKAMRKALFSFFDKSKEIAKHNGIDINVVS